MNGNKRQVLDPRARFLVTALLMAFGASWAGADINLAVLPDINLVQQGEVFDVELAITAAGSEFNGYDAIVGFDPEVLTFIQLPEVEDQEGPLMTGACGNTFHLFSVGPGGDTLTINHVILCPGQRLTGPGVLYRLRFQANQVDAQTFIRLLPGTRFFNAGIDVLPVITQDAGVQVGSFTAVPAAQPRTLLNLRAAPNPFNPQTVIAFDVPRPGPASLAVFAVNGKRVRILLDGFLDRGPRRVSWDGRDEAGRPVGSGVYQVNLQASGYREIKTVTLVK